MLGSLSEGKDVILDRYAYSGSAYSMAQGLPSSFTKAPDCGLPRPDLVLFMQVPVSNLSQRPGFGSEVFEKAELQQRVQSCYEQLREENGREVDASQRESQVAEEIQTLVS